MEKETIKKPPYLESDEEQLLKERAVLGKSDIILVLTNNRVIFLKNPREIINSIKYNQITKIQNSKPSDKKIDENTVSKIRIIDQKGIKTDLSFKGSDSVNKSKKVTSLINKKKKVAEKESLENKEVENMQNAQESEPFLKKDMKENTQIKVMTENALKIAFLEQNAAAKTMFKDLVVEEHILTEEEFWNNFKSEVAEQKTLYQKNGYIFEVDISSVESTNDNNSNNNQNNNESNNAPIIVPKIKDSFPDLNAQKMDQESINYEEFKPSISIQEVSEPILPDEDVYINYQNNTSQNHNEFPNQGENNNKNDDGNSEEEDVEDQNFIWYQEVVEPLRVDPEDFHKEAEVFYSNLESFSLSFNSLPEIVLPPMKDAKSIINEISNVYYRRYNYQDIKNPEIITGLDILRKHKMEQQILLVHFWQNYENIQDQQKLEKTLRLRNKIIELKDIMNSEKESIQSKEARKALIPLYEEIDKSILKVLELSFVSE